MNIGVVSETMPGERRVAITPASTGMLIKAGRSVLVQSGAGIEAGFTDAAYEHAGARILNDRAEVFREADVIAQVRTYPANEQHGGDDLKLLRDGHIVLGFMEPLTEQEPIDKLAETNATGFALELMPRITRAQSMDVLSSQANIGGYKAALLAAHHLPKLFPMMMTAAGTITPARVFVIGAGVAGLQAIATARRLGAVVHAYDIRPAVKEQVESLGATFLEIRMDVTGAEEQGGYAKELSEDALDAQKQQMSDAVAEADVVITTAAVPGREAPKLVTEPMVRRMKPGSVIVDLAAERGGNCELTRPDEDVVEHGVTIIGPSNLPASVPRDASRMYARNVAAFLNHLIDDNGSAQLDSDDEIIVGTMLVRDGAIVHEKAREVFGLEPLQTTSATGGQS